METQNIIIAHPQTIEQANIIKAFMEALKIKFDISKPEDFLYDPEFIAKIHKSKEEFKKGNFIQVEQGDLKHLLEIK